MYLPLPIQRLVAGLFTAVAASLLLSACSTTSANRPLATDERSSVAGGRPLVVRRSAADDRVIAYVWQQQGQFVRIESAESGAAPHQHPVSLTGDQVKQALNLVRFGNADAAPILTEKAIDRIAAPLAEALAQSGPDQEVTFAVAYRPSGFGLLMSRRVTTGRLFRDEEGLQLIIGLLQTPFEEEMRATGQRIAFTPGSRQGRTEQGWSLGSNDFVTHPVAGRDDWIRIDPMAWSASAEREKTMNPPPQQSPRPEPDTKTQPVMQPDRYQKVEERLEALKRLRDKGLISEQAYEQKSREILEEL